MKFVNKTKWNTRDLRKLTLAILKHSGQSKPESLTIIPRNRYGGLATIRAYKNWVRMYVLNPFKQGYSADNSTCSEAIRYRCIPFDTQRYSQILIHEIGHNEGLRHREMVNSTTINIPDSILKINIREIIQKNKVRQNIKEVRLEHAIKMLKLNRSKLQRAEKLVKKWSQKIKYYEFNGVHSK